MVTDWVLVRRLGYELEHRLRGARVADAGLMPDGRIALALRSRGAPVLLAIDAFGSPPLVTIEDGELGIAAEPGFVRSLAATLRGTVLTAVRARRADRLLRFTFSTRSRFGVGDEADMYVELVPRFGNVILVKRDTVVAAAKEFSHADNGVRAVLAGQPYALPPLPPETALVPKLVAGSGVDPARFLEYAQSDAAMHDPVHVYRRDGGIVAAHLVELPAVDGAQHGTEASLLGVIAQARSQAIGARDRERSTRRRNALLKRLDERERKLERELSSLREKRDQSAMRDTFRDEGGQIFATLHELPEASRDEAKDRAAKLFARYKKLGAALPHIDARERDLHTSLDGVRALRWECERAAPEDLDDVEAAVGALDGRGRDAGGKPSTIKRRKRAPLEFRTMAGSRIVVGRTPSENADVTFRVARPNDLWFHAQGIPGAHVVLARDDKTQPPPEDIEAAAALAAFHSRGRANVKVAIDYTARKHVRKQQNAPPGLVWYTNPTTIVVEPREAIATVEEDALRRPSS